MTSLEKITRQNIKTTPIFLWKTLKLLCKGSASLVNCDVQIIHMQTYKKSQPLQPALVLNFQGLGKLFNWKYGVLSKIQFVVHIWQSFGVKVFGNAEQYSVSSMFVEISMYFRGFVITSISCNCIFFIYAALAHIWYLNKFCTFWGFFLNLKYWLCKTSDILQVCTHVRQTFKKIS